MHLLKARGGGAIKVGTWASVTLVIGGVKMAAVAFAWSKKGVSYFITTCGTTKAASAKYMASWQDEYGMGHLAEINRPSIVGMLHDFLPLIDEHNRQRQHELGLETSWPTKCAWFRLLVTVVGMCVVDLHYLYKKISPRVYGDMTVVEFSDILCKNLEEANPARKRKRDKADGEMASPTRNRSPKKGAQKSRQDRGATEGTSKQQACWVCRKYHEKYVLTSKLCAECGKPICVKDRTDPLVGRMQTCQVEHANEANPAIKCGSKAKNFPKDCRKWSGSTGGPAIPPAPTIN